MSGEVQQAADAAWRMAAAYVGPVVGLFGVARGVAWVSDRAVDKAVTPLRVELQALVKSVDLLRETTAKSVERLEASQRALETSLAELALAQARAGADPKREGEG